MSFAAIQQIFEQLPVFILVVFRLAGLLVMAPLLGSVVIPVKIRIMLVLVLSAAVFPLVPPVNVTFVSYLTLAVALGSEMLIGISIGFVLAILFVGVQFGAEMISYQMGLSMAHLIDPLSEISTTVLSQFFLLLATLIYVLIDGHLVLIQSLIQTFRTIPLLSGFNLAPIKDFFVALLTESFKLGIRICGPALIAIFLASLAMGFISRTMPQLNILAAGFPVRIILALVLLIASLGMIFTLFADKLERVLQLLRIGRLFLPMYTG